MSGAGVLDKIAAATRLRIGAAKASVPLESLRARLTQAPVRRSFAGLFKSGGPRIIAEIKRASPSEGPLGTDLDPAAVAEDYAANGAAAISVLTEPEFFAGSAAHLQAVRDKVDLPLLMKDFFIEEYQIVRARLCGADCVILIAALLGEAGLGEMLRSADAFGVDALVEVHDEDEMRLALDAGARLIGVNNRNLKTLEVDLAVSRRLAPLAAGSGASLICESGLRRRSQIDEMTSLGFTGFLIGTHLIKSGRPGAALAELLGRNRP